MKKEEPTRNQPAEKENERDPGLRDRSGIQPGASTISSSDTDEKNEQPGRTTVEGNRENDPNADPVFDSEEE